jgi:hypothetical protein
MYGTVAKLKALPGALEAIRVMESRRPPGFVASYVFQSGADASELWFVVLFESKGAYDANAASPQQNDEYWALRRVLSADPEWHDGQVVYDSHSE